ncbi:MAG: ATP-dependent DNA helicase RecG, partial [Cyanobacteriota bacterium]
AQKRVVKEIYADMKSGKQMNRLLQGDVGSGKTIVAFITILLAVGGNAQSALIAPTEILAHQHFNNLRKYAEPMGITIALLTGSVKKSARKPIHEKLQDGSLHILIGTHALLEEEVKFKKLGLAIIDEQHRFGVAQRSKLWQKNEEVYPHVLVMTATPIPRTLALSIHGDLDVSQIDELPPGRTPIRTALLRGGERADAWRLIREQVELGQRAYVVLPLVEESEKLDLRSAVEVHRHLAEEVFPDLKVGLLHGRLSSEEKQKAIGAFARGDSQVLVSTTVVEGGVDVPAASVMGSYHAERFGLAPHPPRRGRVGRGAAASHCLLINDSTNAMARQRLEVLVRSGDGFEIAEMDLRLRGPGQVLGTRQSGLPDLALASLCDDAEVLEQARDLALRLLEQDPELENHPGLRQALANQRQQEAARLN